MRNQQEKGLPIAPKSNTDGTFSKNTLDFIKSGGTKKLTGLLKSKMARFLADTS
jgi:hypothetical protein